MLLRFRPGLKSFLGDPRFSRRLQITWTFGEHNTSGMPSEDDSEAMGPMEDRLVEALEAEKASLRSAERTGREVGIFWSRHPLNMNRACFTSLPKGGPE